ncbi:MAG: hypothetical protein IKV31_06475 [Paludibacteraceae bacterium]|nr:hypothetical protein [Paludibacteraceae bacterium]
MNSNTYTTSAMRRICVTILVILCSLSSYAVTGLNPYAYKMEFGGQSDNNRKMTFRYWLNAPAKNVSISISYQNDNTPLTMQYAGTGNEGVNEVTVSTAGLPAGTDISWSVTVANASNTEPKQVSTDYRFYCPHGVAIDTDPMSEHFGRILVTETLNGKTGTSGRNYISKTNGTSGTIKAGLYAFDAQFKLIGDKGAPHTGGNSFSQVMGSFTSGYGNFDGGHQPYQVKISDDGRIFVSCCDLQTSGTVVWELSEDLNTWTPIIQGTRGWSNYQLMNENGQFYAGFNCSMDVIGSGKDLKLLLYSSSQTGVRSHHADQFRLDEYPIGTHTGSVWNGTINSIWAPGARKYGVVYDNVRVIYDGEGGYWLGANRATEKENEPNLVHVNANGVRDQYSYDYDFFGGPGIALHTPTYAGKDSKWMFKGMSKSNSKAANGRFGIWKISKNADGNMLRSRIWTVTSTNMGRNHNDFAIDYAENLYIVGNSGERILAFALPYGGVKTTPARSTFTLEAVDNSKTYMVTTGVNEEGYGTTTGDGLYHYEESVTVTATPSDENRYEFVNWTKGGVEVSKSSTYSFTVTEKVDLVANFKVKEFTVEFFNLFQNKQDVTDYYKGAEAGMDKTRNSRLWRWFQVELNNFDDTSTTDKGEHTPTGKNTRFHVAGFFSGRFDVNEAYLLGNTHPTKTNKSNNQAFKWLSDYLVFMNGGNKITRVSQYHDSDDRMGYFMYLFINRTDTAYNGELNNCNCIVIGEDWGSKHEFWKKTNGNYDKSKKFIDYGKPDYWRKWWQQIYCGMDTTWNYDKAMPTPNDLPTRAAADGWIVQADWKPSNWHQWNNQEANPGKLLGWYYGEKNPGTWKDDVSQVKIVHNINKSGNLIAIWVPTEIHEEKNNYDVAKLMTTQGPTHDVKVYRRLQAGMYNTICLPFNVDKLPEALAGATVMRLVGSELENEEVSEETLSDNNVTLNFEQVDFSEGNKMYAGYPYLIMPQTDITDWITFEGIHKDSVYTGEGKTITTAYASMHGHINPSVIEASHTTLLLVAGNQLAVPMDDGEMMGLRAYFTLEGTAAAYDMGGQSALQIGKKVTTDTPEVPEVAEDIETTQPSREKPRKVMYEGKIYIIRGEEVYNMKGERVK